MGDAFWIGVGVGVGVGVIVLVVLGVRWWRRPAPNPLSLEALGLLPSAAAPEPDEVDRLRQDLRLKVMYDEPMIDRLVAAERERAPGATEAAWYRAAIERWERDNR